MINPTQTPGLAAAGDGSLLTATAGRSGEVPRTLAARLGGLVYAADFGAVGDGATDDTAKLNAACAAAAAVGGTVVLGASTYLLGGVLGGFLDGTKSNVTLRGVPGKTVLTLPTANVTYGLFGQGLPFHGWTFDGITFDGNLNAITAGGFTSYFTTYLGSPRKVRFVRCQWRNATQILVNDAVDAAFLDCDFWGQPIPAAHQSVRDPAASLTASLGSGPNFGGQFRDAVVRDCRFWFCLIGLQVSTQITQHARNLQVVNNQFIADWWDGPALRLRFTPSSVTFSGTTATVNFSGGGFNAAINQSNMVASFRKDLASGTTFQRLFQGNVQAAVSPLLAGASDPRVGDVVETSDGRHGRIEALQPLAATVASVAVASSVATVTTTAAHGMFSGGIVTFSGVVTATWLNGAAWTLTGATSTTLTFAAPGQADTGAVADSGAATQKGNYWVSWHWSDTYEPADAPSAGASWWVSRYYGSQVTKVSDTQFTCVDPLHVYTGNLCHRDDGFDPAATSVRILNKINYAGLQINAGVEGVLVEGNYFRGSQSDQCSMFNCPSGVRVLNNHLLYGFDEAITVTFCPNSVIAGNVVEMTGTSIAVWASTCSTIAGNTVRGWGLVNAFVGAVDVSGGLGLTIAGNAIQKPSTSTRTDWCSYGVALRNSDATGTKVSANSISGAVTADLLVDAGAAPTAGAVSARDYATIAGGGAANVGSGLTISPSSTLQVASLGVGMVASKALDVLSGSNIAARINSSSVSGTNFQVINSSTGGRTWTLSTGGQTPAGFDPPTGTFAIRDDFSGNKRLTIDTAGNAAFQAAVSLGSFATGSRPTVTVVGSQVYDTTLGKPIWYAGASVWKDATGATV